MSFPNFFTSIGYTPPAPSLATPQSASTVPPVPMLCSSNAPGYVPTTAVPAAPVGGAPTAAITPLVQVMLVPSHLTPPIAALVASGNCAAAATPLMSAKLGCAPERLLVPELYAFRN